MKIEEIPFGYASCYATDKECAKATHCLRRQVARLYQLQPEPPTTNYCVTPAYVAQVAKGEACREFRSDAPMRYARGMRRLFDHIPKAAVPQRALRCNERVQQRARFLLRPKGRPAHFARAAGRNNNNIQ